MCLPIWWPWAGPWRSVLKTSMSSVPWRSPTRCCACFFSEDILLSIGVDGRHSTIKCQGEWQEAQTPLACHGRVAYVTSVTYLFEFAKKQTPKTQIVR